MATVKSLEERLDEFSEELDMLKAQLAGVTAKLEMLAGNFSNAQAQLATVSAQLAVIASKLEGVGDQLRATNARLDTTNAKLEGLLTSHAVIGARLEAIPDFDEAIAEKALRELAAEKGVKAGVLINGSRAALTGQHVGPSAFHIFGVIGRERVIQRLKAV